ncbi:MAG: hypothetical protein IPO27_16635 [Bacteroidetes bacterium]|nr:hypothetical protein [Bacteroidota bacterium]
MVAVADAVPLALVQLLLSVDEQLTAGLLVLSLTVEAQVAVHPVLRSVTVTVYTPALKPLMLALVSPLLHK